ncbi:MAG: hypothetical protein AAF571_09345 [Verrucomicrobiota bacterium]
MNRLLLYLIITCAVLAIHGAHAEERSLPMTKEEFANWIVGTEWSDRFRYESRDSGKGVVRRFAADGIMYFQKETRKWDEENFIYKGRYEIIDKNTIQFGPYKWSATLSEDFKKYKGTSQEQNGEVKGKFVRRFELK